MLSLPDDALLGAAQRSLPAQHPVFRSDLAPVDYFRHSQRCHAGIEDASSWHEELVSLDRSSLCSLSPDLDLVAGISGRSLMIRSISGSRIARLSVPRSCRVMLPNYPSLPSRLSWRPNGSGVGLLAVQQQAPSSQSKLVLLLATWPHHRIREAVLQVIELNDCQPVQIDKPYRFAVKGFRPLWAPDSTHIAVVPCWTGEPCNLYVLGGQRSLSIMLAPAMIGDWRWRLDSDCLAGTAAGRVHLFRLDTLQQDVCHLSAGYCRPMWAPLLGQQALLTIADGTGLRLLDGSNLLGAALPVLPVGPRNESCALCVGLHHVATCHAEGQTVVLQLLSAAAGQLTLSHRLCSPGWGSGLVQFSPDAQHLAWVCPLEWVALHGCKYSVRVIHTRSGLVVAERVLERGIWGSRSRVTDITWAASGHRLRFPFAAPRRL